MSLHELTKDRVLTLLSALGHRAEVEGIQRLGAEEQTILRAWAAFGVIHNGGFGCFFEGDWDLAAAAQGFRELGFAPAAAACEDVLARLRLQGPMPLGLEGREDWHQRIDWEQFEAQEAVVFELSYDMLAQAVAKYVNVHRKAFEAWVPLGPWPSVVR